MKKYGAMLFFLFAITIAVEAGERYELWPGNAPGETRRAANIEKSPGAATEVTTPYLLVFRPEKKTSSTCLLILPGGGYFTCFYGNEGIPNALWWNAKGMTTAVLVYRVPRPKNEPVYQRAWQDAQRAVRFLRANAEKFGYDPERIGVQGYSAGGHLTLMTALNSQTPAYEPVDALDKIPCHVRFAIPIYPAYVLADGAIGPNKEDNGNNAPILDSFKFDAKTPPLCLVHGDNDIYSPMGSVAVYHKLRKMKIPCEMHIYAQAVHGFMNWNHLDNAKSWQDRCYDWLKTMNLN